VDVDTERGELQDFLDRFVQAWNRHDVRALAEAFLPAGDLLNTRGIFASGRAEVERLLAEEFATTMRDTHATLALTHLRLLAPDTVHADAEMCVEGVRKPDGTTSSPVRMHVAFVARKDAQGQWGYLAVRPYVVLSGF
jgi:uncharacterized protein (TIGR02246 family)